MSRDETKALSRRKFLNAAAAGAGAAAVSWSTASAGAADEADPARKIITPNDFPTSQNGELTPGSFTAKDGITGAQVFAKACKAENLGALFCCPGNYTVINAIAAEGIPVYGGRTEGAMCAAADAFARVTGEVAACSGTEGPGFTQMIMEMSSANACHTPLLVLASNVMISAEDSYRFIQVQDQQAVTQGIRKWGKRIISPNRVHEYAAYAFRNLKTGVPGPVHLDFPGEVAWAKFTDPTQLTD